MIDAAAQTLELDSILTQVSGLTVSSLGREHIEGLVSFTDADDLKEELDRVTEMKDLLEFDDPFPLQGFEDVRTALKRAEIVGAFLDPKDFLNLHAILLMSRLIKKYFTERSEKYAALQKIVKNISPQPELEKEIDRVVDSHGEVKDKASETLHRIRRERNRLESRVRSRLESILQSMLSKGYAQEDTLAFRDGRLVVPIKEAHRARLKGMVLDQSASGATLYVEPLDVLDTNNDIRRLRVQERQEIEKILIRLTDRIREQIAEIKENLMIAGRLDALMARARFSQQIGGHPAEIAQDETLELKQARHPLLMMRESGEEVVPLSLSLGGEVKTLVITGPNAGGKTVALKTVGLLALMHQHGFHVPASLGTSIPMFTGVYADIGDRQSIQQDLSTFSSHMNNIKTILDRVDAHSLVLLDEIGSATDPAEGSALAEVILQTLTQEGCLTLATTHMGSLKVFAHEEPGVGNGSMAFDQKTLRPTYRFQAGLPGSSYAFEIAERLGLSLDMVKAAKQLAGEERGKLDRLIFHMEEELQRTHRLLEEAEIKESRLSGLVKLYQDRLDELQESGEERKQEILQEAEDVLQEANVTMEQLVREIRQQQASREAIRAAKERIQTQKKRIQKLSKKKKVTRTASLKRGDWVVWEGHRGRGEIVSEPDSSGRLLVQWDGFKLRVPASALSLTDGPKAKRRSTGFTSYSSSTDVSNEIDLRGMTAMEALEAVERYLSDAVLAGFNQVGIIHGKGTGVLRREVGKYLKGHPRVKSQRLGNWNEGDTGVTIVELK